MESGNEFMDLLADEKLRDVPILIFANKQDLSNAMKVSEIAEAIGLVKLNDRTWQIQESSAIEGTGLKVNWRRFNQNESELLSFFLQEGMDWVCKNIKKN